METDVGTFDLIVIGTGTAGTAAAMRCRKEGWRVAVVDHLPYGGTCALRGCDPKKVLVGAAEAVDWHRRLEGRGVAGEARLDWADLMRFKRTFTDPVPERTEDSFARAGVATFHGAARFVAPDRVQVGDDVLYATHFVVATGAVPRPLGIPGEELLHTSTDFLELDPLPPHITFVGAGYISFELAHVARRAGADVAILGRGRPLDQFEAQIVDRLVACTEKLGIAVTTHGNVVGVERREDRFRAHYETGGDSAFVDTDLVVHGAGRVPATVRLDLENAGVATASDGAVVVNEYLQSPTNERVYAAGDVAASPGGLPLTPVAGVEGRWVASNLIKGNHQRTAYGPVPSVVFTIPPLASVGLTTREATERGLHVQVESHDTGGWFSNRRVAQGCGMTRVLVDPETDRVVGAHVLGTHADEVINLFALAMANDLPIGALRHLLYAYPTSGSDVPYMV